MRLTVPPLEIDDADPFGDDVLRRKGFADSLTGLITKAQDPLVLALDAPWGAGKTTFVRMWRAHLKSKCVSSIYFDAFEYDYLDDAFVAIAGVIGRFVESLGKDSQARKQLGQFQKTAAALGARLLSAGARVAVKAGTLGLIREADIEALQDVGADIAALTSGAMSTVVEEAIRGHDDAMASVNSFRETLGALATGVKEDTGAPLVIVLDELDRCRPPYALEVLERIKHFFSVDNVVFILAMNKAQLEEAVRAVYGPGVDGRTYLQKFINIECLLPRNDRLHLDDYERYTTRLYDLHEMETYDDKPHLLSALQVLGRKLKFSLRELERAFSVLTIFYGVAPESTHRVTPLIALSAMAKVRYPYLFEAMKHKQATAIEVFEKFGFPQVDDSPEVEDCRKLYVIGSWVQFCLLSDPEFEMPENQSHLRRLTRAFPFDVDRRALLSAYCGYMDLAEVG